MGLDKFIRKHIYLKVGEKERQKASSYTALHCTVLDCILLNCTLLRCAGQHCAVMHCTILCTVLLPQLVPQGLESGPLSSCYNKVLLSP
jgi:hypothetical protein